MCTPGLRLGSKRGEHALYRCAQPRNPLKYLWLVRNRRSKVHVLRVRTSHFWSKNLLDQPPSGQRRYRSNRRLGNLSGWVLS